MFGQSSRCRHTEQQQHGTRRCLPKRRFLGNTGTLSPVPRLDRLCRCRRCSQAWRVGPQPRLAWGEFPSRACAFLAGSHGPEVRAWFRDGGAERVRCVCAHRHPRQGSGGTAQAPVFLIKPGWQGGGASVLRGDGGPGARLGCDSRETGLEITASCHRGRCGARGGGGESRGDVAGPGVLSSYVVNGEPRHR